MKSTISSIETGYVIDEKAGATWRTVMRGRGAAFEQSLTLGYLRKASRFFLGNSLRGLRPALLQNALGEGGSSSWWCESRARCEAADLPCGRFRSACNGRC
jgi:hypothetical protein